MSPIKCVHQLKHLKKKNEIKTKITSIITK